MPNQQQKTQPNAVQPAPSFLERLTKTTAVENVVESATASAEAAIKKIKAALAEPPQTVVPVLVEEEEAVASAEEIMEWVKQQMDIGKPGDSCTC